MRLKSHSLMLDILFLIKSEPNKTAKYYAEIVIGSNPDDIHRVGASVASCYIQGYVDRIKVRDDKEGRKLYHYAITKAGVDRLKIAKNGSKTTKQPMLNVDQPSPDETPRLTPHRRARRVSLWRAIVSIFAGVPLYTRPEV